jgi:predicted DNA-binding protein
MLSKAIRLPEHTLTELRKLAALATIRTGRPVTWSSLAREAIEMYVEDNRQGRPSGRTA